MPKEMVTRPKGEGPKAIGMGTKAKEKGIRATFREGRQGQRQLLKRARRLVLVYFSYEQVKTSLGYFVLLTDAFMSFALENDDVHVNRVSIYA